MGLESYYADWLDRRKGATVRRRRINELSLAWIWVPIWVATLVLVAASRMTRASQMLWVKGFSQWTCFRKRHLSS